MFVDKLLITAQLGGVVATDGLVIIAGLVLVEGVRGEVQYAVVHRLVGQDHLVGLRLRLCLLALILRHEHGIVEVALVHLPQVEQAEHDKNTHKRFGLQLLGFVEQHHERTDEDDGKRAPAVAGEHGLAHLRQVGQERVQVLCGPLAEGLHLLT